MSHILSASLRNAARTLRPGRFPAGPLVLLLAANCLAAVVLVVGGADVHAQAIRIAGMVSLICMLAMLVHHRACMRALGQKLDDTLHRDRLTGLVNREPFKARLAAAIRRVGSGQQRLVAVLFVDCDRFKVINDALGHQAGDDLLAQVSLRLGDWLRTAGGASLVARFGGDEFLVLLEALQEPGDAQLVADGLLGDLQRPFQIGDREVSVQASIGVVSTDRGDVDAGTVLRNADLAMHEAKRAGRNCAVLFHEGMHAQLERKLLLESGLRKALGTDQLTLVYQPIVDLDSGKRSSVEALVRWTHPVLGPVPPSEFVPVAEESGLIVPLGRWVMRESCAALARWRRLDPEHAPGAVSVNVSRAELARGPQLLQAVREALAFANLPPQGLQLEVTEREVMRDPAASLALMHELHEIGVRLAMDDFGTGTSSLGCLSEYPFDVIKIDRSFINGLSAGPDRLAVLHATITLVENLGKSSVGEGVETPEQLATLQAMGCHYAQGYFLGSPMAEAEVVESGRTLTVPRLQLLA